MRARLAIFTTGVDVTLREVSLKEKPAEMLAASPKGTVPVLVLQNGTQVIDESLDIMRWAQTCNPPHALNAPSQASLQLIQQNDQTFKYWLDRYKYHVGYPEHSQSYYRNRALPFLTQLNAMLANHPGAQHRLIKDCLFTEYAVFPFVRQFYLVDPDWFEHCEALERVLTWLQCWLNSSLFAQVMEKHPVYKTQPSPTAL